MFRQRATWVLAMALSGAQGAAAQAQAAQPSPPTPLLVAKFEASPATSASAPAPVKPQPATTLVPARPQEPASASVLSFATKTSPPDDPSRADLLVLRVTRDGTSFLTEARIPLAQLWNGRLRVSAVQQRFHSATMYTTLNPAELSEIPATPGAQLVVARARANYGFCVQFRFGR